ncbi:hypothetical protein G7Z17_g10980 [Cylindrodendrum hubeiense]|uniref:Uncharacterized protein n=1 Tax=Cylindrodendrum hubeiense TaxID=595255 RepID=A0A9P5H3V0_9HYPO|nr:hypothetical protein G7Z17_g10980 [Cylindrodendrum hubeiense]
MHLRPQLYVDALTASWFPGHDDVTREPVPRAWEPGRARQANAPATAAVTKLGTSREGQVLVGKVLDCGSGLGSWASSGLGCGAAEGFRCEVGAGALGALELSSPLGSPWVSLGLFGVLEARGGRGGSCNELASAWPLSALARFPQEPCPHLH